jgi:hypothetical protein
MMATKTDSLDNVEKSAPGLDNNLSNEPDEEFYVDPVKEVKLLAKLDLAFTPVIMLVYLSCFLDRSNIGSYYSTSS